MKSSTGSATHFGTEFGDGETWCPSDCTSFFPELKDLVREFFDVNLKWRHTTRLCINFIPLSRIVLNFFPRLFKLGWEIRLGTICSSTRWQELKSELKLSRTQMQWFIEGVLGFWVCKKMDWGRTVASICGWESLSCVNWRLVAALILPASGRDRENYGATWNWRVRNLKNFLDTKGIQVLLHLWDV